MRSLGHRLLLSLALCGALFANTAAVQAQGRSDAALSALERTPHVSEVALFGDALHIELEEEVAEPEALVRQALDAAGLQAESVQRVLPTMEDVFMHYTGKTAEDLKNEEA